MPDQIAPPRYAALRPARLYPGVLLGVTLALAILYRLSPLQYRFYPTCPIHDLLHIQCPGCGTTRAIAALLHGHLSEALRLNALTVAALPLIALHAVRPALRSALGHSPHPRHSNAALLRASFVVVALFTITRNLPWFAN